MLAAFALALAARAARADSVVVFNEVMYHPPLTNEAAGEWLELRNQLAVDVDLSGWSLEGGVAFAFPEGTVIPGRGYLVVAGDPAALAAAGAPHALGPFAGRLANDGERLELRNNNRRLMDELDYGTEGAWPVAADGAGPALAKVDEDGPTADPANWRASGQMGGSPGTVNTPPATRLDDPHALRLEGEWRYLADGAEPAPEWRSPAFDDSGWNLGTGVFQTAGAAWRPVETQAIDTLFNSGLDASRQALAPGQPDPHYALTASAYSAPPPPEIAATVMANHPNWLANDATSRWIGPVASGSTSVPAGGYQFRTTFDLGALDPASASLSLRVAADNRLTSVALNGATQALSYAGYSAFSAWSALTNGFVAGANTLDFLTWNDGGAPNPAGLRVELDGTAATVMTARTVVPATPATKYFRAAFVVTGDLATASLSLRTVLDDGAVFYLNGAEVLRLNLPAGTVTPATPAVTNVLRAALSAPFDLPADSLVLGTNVLAAEVHQAASGSGDLLFGASLALALLNRPLPPVPDLALNELPAATNAAAFWVELVNHGTHSVSLGGHVLARLGGAGDAYALPAQLLPPGGRVLIDGATAGFGADPGDRLVLYTPGQEAAVDAQVATRYPRARWPEGTGPWLHPAEPTPGATNRVDLRSDIVINELMYHPRDPQGAAADSPEQWVELYNRGAAPADLSGWRLAIDGRTAFRFAAGQTLAPDAYLVVARDAAFLQALYPAAAIVGDLDRRLSGRGGTVTLFDAAGLPLDPAVDPDAAGNPADQVTYGDDAPWPVYADGLGASLELRDPRADNARPAAWSASDDRAKAAWRSYAYTGVAAAETANSPTLWKEFVLGLIGDGEVLLDDLSVVESPDGAAVELLQNGSFETGADAWRLIGNHRRSEVVADPDNAANRVLRLVSTGYTEHMHNHAETTFANGASVVNGRTYRIAFRAKWVAGCNRLLTRLYFNRLPRLTELERPALNGTPGARNSVYTANLGPTFRDLAHAPAVPDAGAPVTVTVTASDPDGVATGVLRYAVNSGAWQAAPLSRRDSATGETALAATIPGQAAGAVVQFYVEAADGLGAVSACPAAGADSRALVAFTDGAVAASRLRSVRFVMTPADAAWLHSNTNVMSNERLGCTLIADETAVAYDAGLHLQGSERGRVHSSRVGFTVRLPWDRPYRGVLPSLTVDRSGGYSNKGGRHDEILLKHAVNKAGGLPGMYDDLCRVFAPRPAEDGTGLLILAKYGDTFLDAQFADGGDGELFKLELVYYPTTTLTGDAQSAKLPSPDLVLGTDIKDLGHDPESYRWIFLKENRADRNHYAPMVALAQAFSLTGDALDARMSELMDVDEWLRGVALLSLIGCADIYTYNNSHNAIIYFRPEDGRAMLFPWDLDYAFVQPVTTTPFPGTGSPNTLKLVNRPANLHAFYGHLYDLCAVTGDAAYMGAWASHYAGLLSQDWSGVVTYLKERADHVRGRLPLATPFAVTNAPGGAFSVTNSPVTLGGSGSVLVTSITVNGVAVPVTWTSATNWTVTVPLPDVTNALALQAYDRRGAPLAGASATVTVINLGRLAPQPVRINEWLADNSGPGGFPDPADGKFQDWFELFNPNVAPVDLSGYTLTDDLGQPAKWTIPSNTVIAGRGFLLVWADDEPFQNGGGAGNDLHAAFKLGADGESLGLFSPQGAPQHALTFGAQLQNVSQGFYPDGAAEIVYGMPLWTPRAANRLGPPPAPAALAFDARAPAGATLSLQTEPGRAYALEYKNDLRDPAWTPLLTNRALSGTSVFTDDTAAGVTQRFYRALLLQ